MTSIVAPTRAHTAAGEKETRLLAGALVLSALAHWAVFAWSPEFRNTDIRIDSGALVALDVPPEIEIPPPPQAIARPAAPVVSDMAVDQEITIAPTTFESNPVDMLPPPPPEGGAVGEAPTFTPMTVKPVLGNGPEIARLLQKGYPPVLKEAGIGGKVLLWVFIDEQGTVRNALVKESSGYSDFDDAAVAIAPRMEFSPAWNRDQCVPVWIALDLVFEVHPGA